MTDSGEGLADEREENDELVIELFARLDEPTAREELVARFQSLAEYLARRFAGRGEPLEDLIQVANVGLLGAIDRFDPGREVRFTTYAAATIIGELKRHLRDKAWSIRVPRRLQELGLKINRTLPALTQELGRAPTMQEIADALESTSEDVLEAMDAVQAYSTASLDAPAGEEGLTPAETLGERDRSLDLLEQWATVAPAVKDLPQRERRVLYLRFFVGMTQSEIAGEVGVSQMHVSRILSQTLSRLRRAVEGDEGRKNPEAQQR
jgi:RNA polymerase sigma-B factor